jgi:hypothetical protein
MSTRVARVVRGLLVAVVALSVAAVAHIATGGQIGSVGLVLAFAFSALASIALAGRTVSRVRISIAVLFSQGVFHVLFGVGAGYSLAPQNNHPGMVMGDPNAATTSTSPMLMTDNGWMWAAHGLAAILTIVALVRGERTFWRIAGWVAHSIARIFGSPIHDTAEQLTAPAVVGDVRAPGTRFLLAGLRRRGPPSIAASM